MLIINADDLGRAVRETDVALVCYKQGRISSASAMVFMEDSERAAALARESGLDVGLHLNLSQTYSGRCVSHAARAAQERVAGFITANKYAVLIYRPGLSR